MSFTGLTATVMGIVNASPESFSDRRDLGLDELVDQTAEQFASGAGIVDLGGQSASTDNPELTPEVELSRLLPLLERLPSVDGQILSVDTYKPEVALRCLQAGAHIINDTSGLLYPEIADVVAEAGAEYVLMHNRGKPKVRLTDPDLYDDVTDDVYEFFAERLEVLDARGVDRSRVILDPGIDFSKTPAQTVEVLQQLDRFESFGCRRLYAVSRKDFIGAITGQTPARRDPGTLAACAFIAAKDPTAILRVHDVSSTVQFLQVFEALQAGLTADLLLEKDLFTESSTDQD